MWSEDYRARDELFCEVLQVLSVANKMNLAQPLTRRMDRYAGDKVAAFNTLCRKLIRRYGK
ncbi:MAG: hypothetical protein IT324_19605 [Anaerolineae bacterium]|nr:hypothetical protein [Anaerolineae bacterium]